MHFIHKSCTKSGTFVCDSSFVKSSTVAALNLYLSAVLVEDVEMRPQVTALCTEVKKAARMKPVGCWAATFVLVERNRHLVLLCVSNFQVCLPEPRD